MHTTLPQFPFALIPPSLLLSLSNFPPDSLTVSNCLLLCRRTLCCPLTPPSLPPQLKGSAIKVQACSYSPRPSHEQLSPNGCCHLCPPFYPHCGLPGGAEMQKTRQRSPPEREGRWQQATGQGLGGRKAAEGKRQGGIQTPRHRREGWYAGRRLRLWGIFWLCLLMKCYCRWKSFQSQPITPKPDWGVIDSVQCWHLWYKAHSCER